VRAGKLALVLAGVLLVISGCGSPAAAPRTAAAVAAAVPDTLTFTARTIDGQPFDAASLAGRPTLLWFWAPWCATCASQADMVAEMRATYDRETLGIVGIAGMGDNAAMHEFVTDLDVTTVPSLDDEAGVLWKKFGVTEQSTYVLIDRTGKVVLTSYLDAVDLPVRIKSLVA
jgi:thiol-disulfide isomerase/thioredoxin